MAPSSYFVLKTFYFYTMDLKTAIQSRSKEIHEEVIALRRKIHANPELAFEEVETAGTVKRYLEALGLDYEDEVAKTGVVGYIQGRGEGPVLALRADMDALPILEANEVDYASQNPGKMHACGHDVHTSSLLGTAKLLTEFSDNFRGTIKLIFQPSEEKFPGGASVMIKEGVLESPKVEKILGQHVMPYIDSGQIGIRSGRYMASADEIYLRVKGLGGHAAHPHTVIDPVLITSHILTTLQTVVSRNADPRMPSVLSFGKVIAQGATNVIPNEVYLEGTFRTMNEPWRDKAHKLIHSIVNNIAESMGGKAELDIVKGYPVLFNDEALTGRVRDHIEDYVGSENIVDLDLWMAAEDFSYYTHQVPGCFYRLGTRNEAKGIVHGLHTPLFNIDEEALSLSTGLMAWLAIRELNG